MASLKDLKNRINSVKNTRKITKAMQMVAAAKLRKAQAAAESSRPYADGIGSIIVNLTHSMAGVSDAPELLVGRDKHGTVLLVVATADRGLCGGFNTNIVRQAREEIATLEQSGKTVKLLLIGRKGREQLERLYADRIVDFISLKEERTLHVGIARDIGNRIISMFNGGEFDTCKLIYAEFKSIMTQKPVSRTLVPAAAAIDACDNEGEPATDRVMPGFDGAIYTYEPDEIGILRTLLPLYINTQIFSALLENQAGEMGSKMTAMDNATRNAGDMIDKLTLTYNRTRQAKITSELIEIISGAEAL
ncbi:MAG: F0F1 ATP synthase subunit gamma [Hyphomonadaceae bacterium]|nr:F0F1 ATP synthase subunit gamma [Hyphomonadaceae bacterium]